MRSQTLLFVRRYSAVFVSLALSLAAYAADNAAKSFNVPAGTAEGTLKQFSEQAGVQVIFPTDRVQGVRTKAVKGELAPADALEQMVAGTELVVIHDEKTGALGIRREASVEQAEKNGSGVAQKSGDRPSDQKADRQDGVVELSPFEVRADKDVGYESLNANSIAGLRTSLMNVPVTAEIYNRQFFDDLGISSPADALLEWASGQSPNGKAGTGVVTPGDYVGNTPFVVRGVASGPPRLDGFMNAGLSFLDNTFQERLEVIRGPQSLLYGISNAGGLVNLVSKQAVLGRNSGRLRLRINEFGTLRAEADANFALNPKLALRVALTRGTEKYYTDYSDKDVKAWYLAGVYRPFQRVTLRAFGGVDTVDKSVGQDSNANLPGDPRSGKSVNLLLAQGDTDGLYFKPIDWSNVDALAGRGIVHHYPLQEFGLIGDIGLASWLDLRVQGQYQRSSETGTLGLNNSQGVLSPAASTASAQVPADLKGQWVTGGRAGYGGSGFYQRGVRMLLNARFDLWRNRISNNFTLGVDGTRQHNYNRGQLYYLVDANGDFVVNSALKGNADAGRTQMPIVYWNLEDGQNPFHLGAMEYVFGGNTYRRAEQYLRGSVAPTTVNPFGYNNATSTGPRGVQDLITWDRGYYGNLATEWFNNRVSTMFGFRRNYHFLRNELTVSTFSPTWANTYNVGGVVHLNKYLSPYFNRSLSYSQNTINGVSQDGFIPNVNNGVGKEAGIKFSVPQLKLSGAVAVYKVDSVNRSVVLNNANAGSQNIVDPPSAINGRHLSQNLLIFPSSTVKGLEVSMTANPTRNWRARFSFSYNSDEIGSTLSLQRWYNDEFNTNSTGQVTFNNGTVAMVNSIAGNTSSPLIPLTVAMMKDPNSGYFADLDTGSGRIMNLGGRSFASLNLVGRTDGLTIGTDRTGLPITDHQLGWVPPTADYVVTASGDRLAIPRSTQSATLTRSFSEGRLRGFSIGLTAVARQHLLAYYYIDTNDGNKRKEKRLPDQFSTNLMLSYRFKLKGKYQFTTQLNVQNLLNHRDLVYIRNVGSGVLVNAKMNAVPRFWTWTNTLEF